MSSDKSEHNRIHQTILSQLENEKEDIANEIVDEQYRQQPQLKENYTTNQKKFMYSDTLHNLHYLSEAIRYDLPQIFTEYVYWLATVLSSRNVPIDDFQRHLKIMQSILFSKFGELFQSFSTNYFDKALERVSDAKSYLSIKEFSYLQEENPLYSLASEFLHLMLSNKRSEAIQLILTTVKSRRDLQDVYLHVFQPVQYEIGRLWQINQISVAQEHYCTAITQLAIAQLYPMLFENQEDRKEKRLLATCIGNELHELGIRMVADIFELNGWDTYYLGANTPSNSIIQQAIDHKVDILALSATLITHVQEMRPIIERLHKESPQIKILVGGYPFNVDSELWNRIGADGFANNAIDAIHWAEQHIKK